MESVLKTKNLTVSFQQYTKGLQQRKITGIQDISLDVKKGELLAIIGASGSGKSIFANAILGILPSNARVSGEIYFKQEQLTEERLKNVRGKEIALVPQTVEALDPLIKVGKQVQLIVRNGNPITKQCEVFERYNLAPEVANMYPHEISGGMARRVLVAIAFLTDADLIIADEPTPGMDIEAVKQTIEEIINLQNKNNAAVIMITHDIQTALQVADRFAIFNNGQIVEIATSNQFVGKGELLKTDYAKTLWRSLPENNFNQMIKGR